VLRKIINYTISKDRKLAYDLKAILGFMPSRLSLYKKAFTHKSNSEKDQKYPSNNERLEFLGDAILDAVTAEYLFKKYPVKDEGFLTQMRSKMVNRKTLNSIGDRMGLDVFIRQFGTERISATMMGNTYEAFVGAIYLDVGYAQTRTFIINRMLRKYIDVHELETLNTNYKSQLLEYCQKNHKTIEYELIKHYRSKENRERFKIGVKVAGENAGMAEDFSKKSAEQQASKKALRKLGLLTDAQRAADA
jgi:ribonuclease-3